MFSLICVWIHGWVNTLEAGDLRRYRAHYNVTVISNIWILGPSVFSETCPWPGGSHSLLQPWESAAFFRGALPWIHIHRMYSRGNARKCGDNRRKRRPSYVMTCSAEVIFFETCFFCDTFCLETNLSLGSLATFIEHINYKILISTPLQRSFIVVGDIRDFYIKIYRYPWRYKAFLCHLLYIYIYTYNLIYIRRWQAPPIDSVFVEYHQLLITVHYNTLLFSGRHNASVEVIGLATDWLWKIPLTWPEEPAAYRAQTVTGVHQDRSKLAGLSLTHWPLAGATIVFNYQFSNSYQGYLKHFPWYCSHVNATRFRWW